jgi:hypothetical protein
LIIYFLFLGLGFISTFAIALSFYKLKRQQKVFSIWFEFKRKIWMTLSLGSFFLFCYFGCVFLMTYLSTNERNMQLFSMAYQSPTLWIYGGLCLFTCLSLCIYLVRMFIKYYFLTKKKDF